LLTVKAVRLLKECDLTAVPDSGGERTALAVAEKYIAGKPVLTLDLPMTRNAEELAARRETAAGQICRELAAGKTVVYLTLGDPTVYSTYGYIHDLVTARGYEAKFVPGVASFCAAAAALGVPLCEGGEPLHILPASYEGVEESLELDGVRVLMKSGKKTGELLTLLEEKGMLQNAALAERVGMDGERLIYRPEPGTESGDFSIVIVK
jgi:precorrin-2/cobalt-factor-2 C20-methyltransferase